MHGQKNIKFQLHVSARGMAS